MTTSEYRTRRDPAEHDVDPDARIARVAEEFILRINQHDDDRLKAGFAAVRDGTADTSTAVWTHGSTNDAAQARRAIEHSFNDAVTDADSDTRAEFAKQVADLMTAGFEEEINNAIKEAFNDNHAVHPQSYQELRDAATAILTGNLHDTREQIAQELDHGGTLNNTFAYTSFAYGYSNQAEAFVDSSAAEDPYQSARRTIYEPFYEALRNRAEHVTTEFATQLSADPDVDFNQPHLTLDALEDPQVANRLLLFRSQMSQFDWQILQVRTCRESFGPDYLDPAITIAPSTYDTA